VRATQPAKFLPSKTSHASRWVGVKPARTINREKIGTRLAAAICRRRAEQYCKWLVFSGFVTTMIWRPDGRTRQLAPAPDIHLGAACLLGAVLLLGQGLVPWAVGAPAAVTLKPGTLAAFDTYVKLADARNDEELRRGTNLLWIDALSADERSRAYEVLQRGEVRMQRLETRANGEKISCPGGMIHHWVGAVFVPGAKLPDVLAVLQDYDHHAQYYAPDVEQSKIESHDDDHFLVFLRFRRHKVITVVLNTRHDVRYFRDSATREHSRSSAVHIAEVENAGKPDEREKPPGEDGGYLWRMETWWRMEERDGGVYIQSEVASLTRDIPAGLGWLIGPFVTSIPKETLTFTLQATRKAVLSHSAGASAPGQR
jgi:hypothetical protein